MIRRSLGLPITPMKYISQVHEDQLREAREQERVYLMDRQLANKPVQPPPNLKRKQPQPPHHQPSIQQPRQQQNQRQQSTTPQQQRRVSFDTTQPPQKREFMDADRKRVETENEKKLITLMYEQKKRKEVQRLRAKRKEYEDFLREKLKDRK